MDFSSIKLLGAPTAIRQARWSGTWLCGRSRCGILWRLFPERKCRGKALPPAVRLEDVHLWLSGRWQQGTEGSSFVSCAACSARHLSDDDARGNSSGRSAPWGSFGVPVGYWLRSLLGRMLGKVPWVWDVKLHGHNLLEPQEGRWVVVLV